MTQAFTDTALTNCDECGGPLRKVYGSIGIVFKGGGFYRTENRKERSSSSGGNGSSGSNGSSAGKAAVNAPESIPPSKKDTAAEGSADSGSTAKAKTAPSKSIAKP